MTRAERSTRRSARARAALALLAIATVAGSIGAPAASTAQAAPPRPGATAPVQPDRVLDTRRGLGASGPVQPGTVVQLPIPAASGAGATSVMLNVTATEASGPGWVRVWPCGSPQPSTSSLNFVPGQIAANAVAVKLGSSGSVCLSTYAPVHLVADVTGWFTGTSDFTGTTPNRILDTRETGNPLRAGEERRLTVGGTAGIPGGAAFAALNLTVASPPEPGWVVAYPCGSPTKSSTVNFTAGEIVANLTFVGLAGNDVCLQSYGTTDLVVDTYGWSGGSGDLKVQSPQRLVDTRTWGFGQLHTGQRIDLRVAGVGGVPNSAAGALLTVTVADTGGNGFVTAWPCDQPLPTASTINTWPDQLRSNLAMVKLSATDGTACLQLYTSDNTALDLVVDVVGWVNGSASRSNPPPAPTPPTPPVTPAPSPSGHFGTLPTGSTLPSDAQCAAAVRAAGEIRPDNAGYNATRGSTQQSGWFARVTGNFTGTTDQIIQWAACKWGIDEDIVRAQAAKESGWHQNAGGDWTAGQCAPGAPRNGSSCAESVGVMQVRFSAHKTAFPSALTSTAYNVDYALAVIRSCFEGRETWLNQFERGRDYAGGDLWGCVGLWFSGRWYFGNADYLTAVHDYLDRRVWAQPDFVNW